MEQAEIKDFLTLVKNDKNIHRKLLSIRLKLASLKK